MNLNQQREAKDLIRKSWIVNNSTHRPLVRQYFHLCQDFSELFIVVYLMAGTSRTFS